MKITSIKPQKKNKKRFNVYVDSEYSFSSDLYVATKYKLSEGRSVTKEIVEKIIKEDDFAKYYDRAMNYLSFRPRSQKELTDYLKKHNIGSLTFDMVLAKLSEYKYIDDLAFSKWFVGQRNTFRPKGKKVLRQELYKKGIATDTIEQVLQSTNEQKSLEKIMKKITSKWQHEDKRKRRQKQIAYLLRRGFSWENIQKAVDL